MELFERLLDGKRIYAVGLNSPQELEKFCIVDYVKGNIEKRIQECEKASQGQNYILIVPFGIYKNEDRTKLNEECILKPIEWLRARGFEIFPIYLRKENATHLLQKDSLMKKVTSTIIMTQKHDCDKSRELESFIKNLP